MIIVSLMPNKNQHLVGAYYSPETELSSMQYTKMDTIWSQSMWNTPPSGGYGHITDNNKAMLFMLS